MYPQRYHQRQQRPYMYQMFLQTHEVAQMPLVIPILLPILLLALMLLPMQSIQVLMLMGNTQRACSRMGLAMLQRIPSLMPTLRRGS